MSHVNVSKTQVGASDSDAKVAEEVDYRKKLSESISDLVHLDSSSTFKPLLCSEIIIDTMSGHLATACDPMTCSTRKLSAILAPVTAENSWKAALEENTDIDQVQQRASTTILKMDTKGAALSLR